MTQNHLNATGLQRPGEDQIRMHRRINDRPWLVAMGCRPWKDHEREAIRPPVRNVKRNAKGIAARPGKGIWPPPVYEAHYRHYGRFGRRTRIFRMSFWSPKGKPVDASRGRSLTAGRANGVEMITGYVCQGANRWQDDPAGMACSAPAVEAKRVTAKQVREGLSRLLACLDGAVTDHDEIRQAVIAARKLAA